MYTYIPILYYMITFGLSNFVSRILWLYFIALFSGVISLTILLLTI